MTPFMEFCFWQVPMSFALSGHIMHFWARA